MKTLTSRQIDAIFGDTLREYRRAAGLTQAQLGEAAGVTFQQVQKYERGHNRVSVSRLFQIAPLLGVEPATLIAQLQKRIALAETQDAVITVASRR